MIDQLRSELLKVRSTRTTLGLLAGMIALTLLFAILTGLLSNQGSLYGVDNQDTMFGVGGLGDVFSALAGAMLISSEFRHGTIRPTFLFTPTRIRVMNAKLIAGALTGLAFGVITVGLSFGIGSLILSARGIPAALDGGQMAQLTLGGVGAAALAGIIGVGVGAIVRNQVGAIIVLLAWDFVLDTLLYGLVPSVGRFLPSPASDALMGLTNNSHVLGPLAGGLSLVGWAALLGAIGIVMTLRRDVN